MSLGPMIFGVVSGLRDAQASDPYFANVALLLHGNGADMSTTVTDNSPSPKTVTVAGSGGVRTAQKKFGSGSLIAGSGIGYVAALAAMPGDYTAEVWVMFTSPPSLSTILNLGGGYSGGMLFRQSSGGQLEFWYGTSQNIFPFTPTLNVWHHYAISRVSGVNRIFVDGIKRGSDLSNSFNVPSGDLQLGRSTHQPSSEFVTGYFDDLRVTIGVGRYTADFSVPTDEYPNS